MGITLVGAKPCITARDVALTLATLLNFPGRGVLLGIRHKGLKGLPYLLGPPAAFHCLFNCFESIAGCTRWISTAVCNSGGY